MDLRDSLVTTHEDLGIVLIQSTLVVSDGRHVLDDDGVVRVFALLVEYSVCLNHVVNDVRLGDLLGAELLLGAQVLTIVVAKMVIGGNGSQLNTGADQEVDESRLHLGLARLEVVATNEGVVLLSELNAASDKCVLWRAVDEWSTLKDRGNRKNGGRSDLGVTILDGLHEVIGSVVDARNELSESLSVCGPLNDDLVQAVLGLEVTEALLVIDESECREGRGLPNVLADLLNMLEGSLATGDAVVGTLFLVGGNEVRIVDAGKRDHLSHLLLDLGLESGLQDGGSVHGIGQVHAADVPATNGEIIGVNHGENIMERNVDVLGSLSISAELHGRAHDNRAIVVSSTRTLTSVPGEALTVGNDTSSDSCTIVTAPADKHHTSLGDLTIDLEVVEGLLFDTLV